MRGLFSGDRAIVSELVSSFSADEAANTDVTSTFAAAKRSILSRYFATRGSRTFILLSAIVSQILAVAVSVLLGTGVLVLCMVLLVWSANRKVRLRRQLLERDLPAMLTSVASSVRAGIDPLRALCDTEEHFPTDSLFPEEVRIFQRKLAGGIDEFDAIEQFFAAEKHPDVELFKRCLSLSRRHGSSLAEPLHRVVRVVRQRQSFRRKTRAALAMHRMSAIGIAGLAVFVALMQVMLNVEGIKVAVGLPVGMALIGIGGALVICGVSWMLMMGREETL